MFTYTDAHAEARDKLSTSAANQEVSFEAAKIYGEYAGGLFSYTLAHQDDAVDVIADRTQFTRDIDPLMQSTENPLKVIGNIAVLEAVFNNARDTVILENL